MSANGVGEWCRKVPVGYDHQRHQSSKFPANQPGSVSKIEATTINSMATTLITRDTGYALLIPNAKIIQTKGKVLVNAASNPGATMNAKSASKVPPTTSTFVNSCTPRSDTSCSCSVCVFKCLLLCGFLALIF